MNCTWVDGKDHESLSTGDIVFALTDTRPFQFMTTAVFNGERLIGGYPNGDLPVKKWLRGVELRQEPV